MQTKTIRKECVFLDLKNAPLDTIERNRRRQLQYIQLQCEHTLFSWPTSTVKRTQSLSKRITDKIKRLHYQNANSYREMSLRFKNYQQAFIQLSWYLTGNTQDAPLSYNTPTSRDVTTLSTNEKRACYKNGMSVCEIKVKRREFVSEEKEREQSFYFGTGSTERLTDLLHLYYCSKTLGLCSAFILITRKTIPKDVTCGDEVNV